MHARAQASNRLARTNRASHGPRVRAKERVKKTRRNVKENQSRGTKSSNQGAKCLHKGNHRKLLYQVFKTRNQREVHKLRNLHKHVPLTTQGFVMDGVLTNGMMAGVLTNGMLIGVLLDGMKVGHKRMPIPQAHFHLEVWMSVPPAVRDIIPIEFWSRMSRRWRVLSNSQGSR